MYPCQVLLIQLPTTSTPSSSPSTAVPTVTFKPTSVPSSSRPSSDPTSSRPSSSPSSSVPSVVPPLVHYGPSTTICPQYSASSTSNAQNGYATCSFTLCPGQSVVAGSCGSGGSCTGDEYLRLHTDLLGTFISSDDACGRCSQISYTMPSGPSSTCQEFVIHEGCYSSGSCTGVVSIVISGYYEGPRLPTTSHPSTR